MQKNNKKKMQIFKNLGESQQHKREGFNYTYRKGEKLA